MGATRVFETPAAVPPASQSLAMARMGFSAGAATTTALRSDCNPTIVSECWHFRHNASSRFSYTITTPPPPPPVGQVVCTLAAGHDGARKQTVLATSLFCPSQHLPPYLRWQMDETPRVLPFAMGATWQEATENTVGAAARVTRKRARDVDCIILCSTVLPGHPRPSEQAKCNARHAWHLHGCALDRPRGIEGGFLGRTTQKSVSSFRMQCFGTYSSNLIVKKLII